MLAARVLSSLSPGTLLSFSDRDTCSFRPLQDFKMYLDRQSEDPTEIGTLQFFSYLIVLSNLVPISLYVRCAVQVAAYAQCFLCRVFVLRESLCPATLSTLLSAWSNSTPLLD